MLRELLSCRDDDPGVRKVDHRGRQEVKTLANRWSVWLGGCEPSSAPDLPVGSLHFGCRLGTSVPCSTGDQDVKPYNGSKEDARGTVSAPRAET